jgi:hypothetical protein
MRALDAEAVSHAIRPPAGDAHAHARHFSLLMHRRIAARLLAGDCEPVAKARANLAQWSADRQGQLAPAHVEWMALLDRASAEELAALIASDDEEADRLRSSSPFAGVIDQRERIELWREAR